MATEELRVPEGNDRDPVGSTHSPRADGRARGDPGVQPRGTGRLVFDCSARILRRPQTPREVSTGRRCTGVVGDVLLHRREVPKQGIDTGSTSGRGPIRGIERRGSRGRISCPAGGPVWLHGNAQDLSSGGLPRRHPLRTRAKRVSPFDRPASSVNAETVLADSRRNRIGWLHLTR
jgi:hypothetical protein